MSETSNQPTAGEITLIFVLIGLFAAGIPFAMQALNNFIEVSLIAEDYTTSLMADVETQPTEALDEEGPAVGGRGTGDDVNTTGEAVFVNTGCTACHSVDGSPLVGPSIQGLGDRAGDRVPDLSAEEYVEQSIVAPNDHIVEGFDPGLMPGNYGEILSPEEIDALIEYLLAQ